MTRTLPEIKSSNSKGSNQKASGDESDSDSSRQSPCHHLPQSLQVAKPYQVRTVKYLMLTNQLRNCNLSLQIKKIKRISRMRVKAAAAQVKMKVIVKVTLVQTCLHTPSQRSL